MIVRVFKLLFVTSLTFERSFSQNVYPFMASLDRVFQIKQKMLI